MEGLMYNKALKSQVFAMQLSRFYMYPVLFAAPMNPAIVGAPQNNVGVNTQAISQNMVSQQGAQ
jgi:hypothetical protein